MPGGGKHREEEVFVVIMHKRESTYNTVLQEKKSKC